MSDTLMASATLSLPRPLWESVKKMAKAQKREADHLVEEALAHYISNQAQQSLLTPEERKAVAIKKLYERAERNRRAFKQAVAEGKVHPLPKDIPLEQVRKGLSGIKGLLAAEIIKEREEGW